MKFSSKPNVFKKSLISATLYFKKENSGCLDNNDSYSFISSFEFVVINLSVS